MPQRPRIFALGLTVAFLAAYGCTNNAIPGRDLVFRTYVPSAVPVRHDTWGKVKSLYR